MLNRVVNGAAILAGVFMVSTLLCVLASIVSRLIPALGWYGLDAYAGYSMAAASFLALASTLRHGEHIRVTLLLGRLRGKPHRGMEIVNHIVGLFIAAALAWFSIRLVWQSHQFEDISTGLDATPLWIPQLGMAIGAVLLVCVFAQELFTLMAGRDVVHEKHDAAAAFME